MAVILFIIGILIGVLIGMYLMALLVANKRIIIKKEEVFSA